MNYGQLFLLAREECSIVTIISTSYHMFLVMYIFLMQYYANVLVLELSSVVVLCILTLMCNI